jgi:putative ABC transport system permease protein
MLQRMGWKSPEEALGKPFVTPTGSEKIIGVVQDFHFESLRNPMGPFVLDMPHRWQKPFWVRQMAVRLEKGDFRQQTEILRAIWNKQAAGFPFEFNLLTEELEAQYQDQEKLAGLFAAGAVIAIFLGCLGLLALSAYNASQRTKEIGIRKVLGAGTGSIIRLLSGSFLKLVIIANLLALPITWFLMEYWLNQFAFRIEIPLSALLTGSLLSIIISLGTVVFQAMKAAIGNPVKALRYE